MCSRSCAKTSLFLFSLSFFLIGAAALCLALYVFVLEPISGRPLVDRAGAESRGADSDLCRRVLDLYVVVTAGVAVGWGLFAAVAGIVGMVGACKEFRTASRTSERRSNFASWAFLLVLVFFITGFLAGWILFVGTDGQSEDAYISTNTTKRPDHEINWKWFDLQDVANQIFNDLTTFYWKSESIEKRDDAGTFVRNTLYLTGGVLCALLVLQLLWLTIGCCVSCGAEDDDDAYFYVSPEQQSYDDWITGKPGYGVHRGDGRKSAF